METPLGRHAHFSAPIIMCAVALDPKSPFSFLRIQVRPR